MATHRNLVVVIAHGLRSDALSDVGAWPLQTPTFEKLGSRGLRGVAVSAAPYDPGGAWSLLTGLHPRQHGRVSSGGLEATVQATVNDAWPAWLEREGYFLAGCGLVAPVAGCLDEAVIVAPVEDPAPKACAYFAAMAEQGLADALSLQRRQRLRAGPFEPDRLLLEPGHDIDGFIGRRAVELLGRLPDDRPWALMVHLSGPDNALPPPSLYDGLCDRRGLETPFAIPDFTCLDALAELDYPRSMLQRVEPHRLAQIRSDYLGRVSLIDYVLSRLSRAAGARPDVDRTWMIVASDRGCLLGEHGLVGHRSFLAPAVETPLLIVPPTQGSPASSDLISTVDIPATIASIAGADMPDAVIGRSLLPLLVGDPLPQRTPGGVLLAEFGRRLMLETERYKAIFDTQTRSPLALYDLLNDADERSNLTQAMVGRNLLDALRWRLGDALMALRASPAALA